MSGWGWKVTATCTTDGATAVFTGPYGLVAVQWRQWLTDHDRHEFSIVTGIERHDPIDVPVAEPTRVAISTRNG